jgi:hypothetical protein
MVVGADAVILELYAMGYTEPVPLRLTDVQGISQLYMTVEPAIPSP